VNKENQSKEREKIKGKKHARCHRPLAVNPVAAAALPVEP
jgi:hypothetical protein